MSWKIKMVDRYAQPKQVGDMWFQPSMIEDYDFYLKSVLSDQYKRNWLGIRPPLCVRIPGDIDVCLDNRYSSNIATTNGEGWTVLGDAPNITVTPSLNYQDVYHGWIRDGVMSDDVEGRTYG